MANNFVNLEDDVLIVSFVLSRLIVITSYSVCTPTPFTTSEGISRLPALEANKFNLATADQQWTWPWQLSFDWMNWAFYKSSALWVPLPSVRWHPRPIFSISTDQFDHHYRDVLYVCKGNPLFWIRAYSSMLMCLNQT